MRLNKKKVSLQTPITLTVELDIFTISIIKLAMQIYYEINVNIMNYCPNEI